MSLRVSRLKNWAQDLHLNDGAVPWVLLLAVFLSFGLLIPWLGFYWDDWTLIYIAHTQGADGMWDFFRYVHPLSAWNYVVFDPILGSNPMAWKVFALVLRWLTAVFLWLVLKTIWGGRRDQAFWISLLFAVCPIFFQQQVAVAYSQHWICFLLYSVSLYLMLRAQESEGYFYVFTSLAILFSLVQLFTLEYLIGLELLRPVLLWFYLREREPQISSKHALARAMRVSSVYIGALVLYVVARFLFLHPAEANQPVVLSQLVNTPLMTMVNLVERVFQDTYYLLTSWIVWVNPLDVSLTRPFSLAVLALIGLSVIVFGFLLRSYRRSDPPALASRGRMDFIILGLVATVLAMLPVWAIGRQVTLGGDRFSFAAMLGVSIFLVGVLDWLSADRNAKIAVLLGLLALSIHTNLYIAKAFQYSWERQKDFFWQLFWRAPHLQMGTAIISDGELFTNMGLYSTSFGISLLYPPVDDPRHVPIWFFNYHEGINKIVDKLVAGAPLDYRHLNHTFSAPGTHSLLLVFPEGAGECLQILSSNDRFIKQVPAYFQDVLSLSSPERIKSESALSDWMPPKDIFGSEPRHTWCYFYQKADLARQSQEWDEVTRLFDEARAHNMNASNESENLLFVDAFLQQGDFERAEALTFEVTDISKRNNDSLCAIWANHTGLQKSPAFVTVYDRVSSELNCST